MPVRRRLIGCALLTAVALAAALFPLPALTDAVTGLAPRDARLEFPLLHAALAPFSAFADVLVCQSARADIALLAFMLTLGFGFFRLFVLADGFEGWRRPAEALKALGAYLILLLLLVAWAALAPRPGPRLALDDENDLAVDFHSHTSASWDGRKSFDPVRSARWHQRAGFDAGFVTDHNVFAGAANAHGLSRLESQTPGRGRNVRAYVALEGEELSVHGAHVVLLGNRAFVDPRDYSDGLPGLERLLRDAGPKHGALAIMSLPEYNRSHWERLEALADWGADGFELVSASPRGLDFPRERLARVSALCRERGLLAAGATDNHGYGGSACVWSVARLPGWRAMSPDALQENLIAHLRRRSPLRVLERPRLETPRDWTVWLQGPRALFDALRRLPRLHSFFTLLWAWAPWLFGVWKGTLRSSP